MTARFEIVVELHRDDEREALAVAEALAREHAATVTAYRVTPGRTFADSDDRMILATWEA